VSKRGDRCLSGSSALESPEKVRGIEELNDSFRIEFEDYELQQEEMEEGFTCTSCMSKNDATAYPFCVCCGFKVSWDENVCIIFSSLNMGKTGAPTLMSIECRNGSVTRDTVNYL
jgi:hypothetical protein